MAYSDFDNDYVKFTSEDRILDAAQAGEPITHASLTDPLTESGEYCRRFFGGPDSSSPYGFACLKLPCASSVLGGSLVSPSPSTAISLRMRVRADMSGLPSDANTKRYFYCGVNAFTRLSGGSNSVLMGGWDLVLRANSTDTTSLDLVLRGGPTINATFTTSDPWADPNYNVLQVCEAGLSENTWYQIRLDIIPNSASEKTINCYRHDGTDWVLLHTRYTNTALPDWPSATTYNRCGITCGYAFGGSQGPYLTGYYVDDFQVSTETV